MIAANMKSVLIVEDRQEIQVLLRKLVQETGIPVSVAGDGREAVEMVEKQIFSIFIVDLMLPEMDGRAVIEEIKKKVKDPVILVETALDSSDTIIEIMKLGVFDYILKPIDSDLFRRTLHKALEYKKLRDDSRSREDNVEKILRNQLEWLTYKETQRQVDKESQDLNAIYNLRSSLADAGGLGVMISLIDMLQSYAEVDGEFYRVDKGVADLLFENSRTLQNLLGGLERITAIMDRDLYRTQTTVTELMSSLRKNIEVVQPYMEKRKVKLSFPDRLPEISVLVDSESMLLAMEELIVNAVKYSREGDNIGLHLGVARGYLHFSVHNHIEKGEEYGIPEKYEKLILEPFFRLRPPVSDAALYEKFGLGLGLTIVDYVVKKHNGLFFIHSVRDHFAVSPEDGVLAEVYIPLEETSR